MSRTAALADHLDRRCDSILARWRETLDRAGDVPDAARLDDEALRDHLPEILDGVVGRLRGEGSRSETRVDSRRHGHVRWAQGFSPAEVVAEIGHLRAGLHRAAFAQARRREIDLETLEAALVAIDAELDAAAAESTQVYHEDCRAEASATIDEAGRRGREVEADRERLRAVLDDLPVGVWVLGADGAVSGLNREAERFGDAATTALLRLHRDALAHDPDEPPRSGPIPRREVHWRVDGRDLSVVANPTPQGGRGGQTGGAVVVAHDVTDRKAQAAELAESERRFRSIAEQSPAMIWRADASGRRDFFNRSWLDFRGRAVDDESGEGWAQGIEPEDRARVLDEFRRAAAGVEPFELVYRLRRADGAARSIVDRAAPYFDTQGALLGYLGTAFDLTERVDLEASLARQSEHKSRLMAALSHDARTPLNAVVLAAQLLETQVKDQDDPEVRESLRVIRNAVRNVLDLLTDLLDLARIDAGANPAEIRPFPLGSTLRECLSSIEPQARAKGLAIRPEFGPLEELTIATDRGKLKQIFANFLSNALRYTEAGTIRIVGERSGEGEIRLSVEDTGVGIAEADQARIFDEFATLGHRQNDGSDTTGTGLGLAICRRLALLLGGEIRLESRLGVGSRFTLALPGSVAVEAGPGPERPSVPRAPLSPEEIGPVLVAEDHEPSRRVLARVLRGRGYRVLEAGDGGEAVQLARAERPGLILMDINMPGVDGVDATLALKSDPATRDLPIFALTGDVTPVNHRRIEAAGIDGTLEKPVSWDQIERALETLRPRRIPPFG